MNTHTPEEIIQYFKELSQTETVPLNNVLNAFKEQGYKGELHYDNELGDWVYSPAVDDPKTDDDPPVVEADIEQPDAWTGSTSVTRYVDKAMFEAEQIEDGALKAPKVYLLQATPDPLGSLAAMMMMYQGRVVRDLSEITDQERAHHYGECFKTVLDTPLESIDFHFMVEGITRAFSHQEVRQRTAVFAQESMRFAVKEKIEARPGPIVNEHKDARQLWETTVDAIWHGYLGLIAAGVPAEEARGLLPHDTLTRMHHKVNLRSLKQELGKRTCTQAQFDWRLWAAAVRRAIWEYSGFYRGPDGELRPSNWQFQLIAESAIFRPICFSAGKCMFQAGMDRGCTIRDRVDKGEFDQIKDEEWASDPTAGWVR